MHPLSMSQKINFINSGNLEKRNQEKNNTINFLENGMIIETAIDYSSRLSLSKKKVRKPRHRSLLPWKVSKTTEKLLKNLPLRENNHPFLFRPFSQKSPSDLEIKENYWKKVFEEGNIELVRVFLKSGIDKNQRFSDDRSPLSIACENQHVDVVKMLIANGVIKHTKHQKNQTPLMIACQNGNKVIAQLLMTDQKSGNLHIPPEQKDAILEILLKNGNTEIFELLLNEITEEDINQTRPGCKHNFMVTACKNGHLPLLHLLAEKGGDLHFYNSKKTLLAIACKNQHVEIVRFLLKHYVSTDVGVFQSTFLDSKKNPVTPLGIACQKKSLEIVQLLVDSCVDIEKESFHRGSPLIVAAQSGRVEIVNYLLDRGANIEKKDSIGNTALMNAIQEEHLPVIQLLIDRGANINTFNNKKETPLSIACRNNMNQLVEFLISKGANINGSRNEQTTLLMIACENNNEELFHFLLEKGVFSNTPDSYRALLSTCCKHGHQSLVELLISKGALVEASAELIQIAYRFNQLHLIKYFLLHYGIDFFRQASIHEIVAKICLEARLDVLKIFLDAQLQLNACYIVDHYFGNFITLFDVIMRQDAIDDKKIEALRFLLENKMDVNLRYNENSSTALHIACQQGNIEIVKLLLDFGANVFSINELKTTPLNIACSKGNLEIVRLLLIHGDTANIADISGNDCLISAVESKNPQVVRLILDCAIHTETENQKGETALDIACLKDIPVSIIQTLLAKGANPHRVDDKGNSLFLRICKCKKFNVAQLMIDRNIDINTRNKKGETVLDYFYRKKMPQIIAFLEKNHAKTASELDASFHEDSSMN